MKAGLRCLVTALGFSFPLLTMNLPALGTPPWSGVREARAQYSDAVLDPDPRARVFALAIRFPTGSAGDQPGREGTAFLLGRVLEQQGAQALARYGSSLRIEVSTDEFLITLVSAPSQWLEATIELEHLIYEADLSATVLETAREGLLEILAFEAGAPVRAFELERRIFLLGPTNPAARPLQGTLNSIRSLTAEELEAFRSSFLQAEGGVLAAHGPAQVAVLSSLLSQEVLDIGHEQSGVLTGGANPGPVDSIPPAPTASVGPLAWTTTDRVLIDEELTSSWISVAFPFPQGTPELLLDFLGHLVIEDLTPSPPEPGLFDAQVSRIEIRGAPVLVVTATGDPRVTSRWEERLRGSVPELAVAPPEGMFFELARRRYRASLLLALAVPEDRARWLAQQVASGRDPSAKLDTAVWSLQRDGIAEVAGSAGSPRTILFGPRDMMDR